MTFRYDSVDHDSMKFTIISLLAFIIYGILLWTEWGKLWNAHGFALVHILTAITAFGALAIAGFQALLLHIQNASLKTNPRSAVLRFLPPIETMETFLFQTILLGFLFLSISLFIALGYMDNLYTFSHLHKILLSFLAWIFFAILLYKHYQSGWRGKTAVKWTLSGLTVLLTAYLSSKWILLSH